jgi:serine/threonine protein kinase
LKLSPSQIEKEEKIKNDSSSELIVVNPSVDAGSRVVVLEDFKIKKLIDKGSFGKVFLVVNTVDNKTYALKRINKDILVEKGQILNTRTEKDILSQANNPFIINMKYVFQNKLRLYFILDYVEGGNIFDHLCRIRRFDEEQTKFITA